MLILTYIFALTIGGVLLGASFLLGGDDIDADVDADVDVDVDADADFDMDADADHGLDGLDGHADAGHDAHGDIVGFFGVLGSLRFWTFFTAFYGLTGLLLDGLELVHPPVLALGFAIGIGTLVGWSAVAAIRRLAANDTGVAAGVDDYVGKSGEMLLGAGPGRLGKVRIELRGTTVDVLAVCEDGELARGEQALIIEMRDHTAVVHKLDTRPAVQA